MHQPLRRRRLLATGMGLGAAGLAGLGLLPAARACEVQAEFLRVTHPWSRATAQGAHHGVLCMRIDEVSADDRLIGVHTPVAMAAHLAGTAPGTALDLPIRAGSDIEMHEQGLHLVLSPLLVQLHAGRAYPLRLTFARSGVVHATLNIDFPRFS